MILCLKTGTIESSLSSSTFLSVSLRAKKTHQEFLIAKNQTKNFDKELVALVTTLNL